MESFATCMRRPESWSRRGLSTTGVALTHQRLPAALGNADRRAARRGRVCRKKGGRAPHCR
eukprot:355528-Chlamydomonas_euryale.AAC.12